MKWIELFGVALWCWKNKDLSKNEHILTVAQIIYIRQSHNNILMKHR